MDQQEPIQYAAPTIDEQYNKIIEKFSTKTKPKRVLKLDGQRVEPKSNKRKAERDSLHFSDIDDEPYDITYKPVEKDSWIADNEIANSDDARELDKQAKEK
jgi:hypothetical protein